jgi:hypothetical protein
MVSGDTAALPLFLVLVGLACICGQRVLKYGGMDELSSIEPSGFGAIGLYLDIISAVFAVLEQGLRVLIMVGNFSLCLNDFYRRLPCLL